MKRKTTAEFIEEISDSNFTLIGEYINSKTKVCLKSKTTNKEYHVRPMDFLYYGISEHKSKGEQKIESILKKSKVKYKPQYRIPECKDKESLPFDFAIFFRRKLIMVIEYQGKQHFEPIEYFGGVDSFREQVRRDAIKEIYCYENDIPLLLHLL